MSKEHDNLFSKNRALTAGFKFDDQVVRVFPDMISRSVPGYELVVPMISLLARRYAQPDSNIYDLGCSLGAVSLAVSGAVRAEGVQIIAVDNSAAMVKQLRSTLDTHISRIPIDVRLQDVLDTDIDNASVVVLNYTLQFVESDQRQELLDRVAAGIKNNGVLIISEKIHFENTDEQAHQTAWHHDFKRTHGYSGLEIARKRDALENVLKPDTEVEHIERLQRAGFGVTRCWFRCFSFASYIAFK
jgi:tRNA (cmo5U34)-methyltransferase